MHRSILPVLLTFSLVLAGCNGVVFGGNETPPPTLTPANVPTDRPTPTPVPQLVPGLTGKGVTDAFALANAHAAILDNTSYSMRGNYTVVYSNGTKFNHGRTDAQLAANDSRYYVIQNISGLSFNGSAFSRATWSNGKHVLVAETTNNSTLHNSPRSAEGELVSPEIALRFNPTNRE